MPKLVNSPQFLIGVIFTKMQELQVILDTLASEVQLSENEMRNMRRRIDAVDQSIHTQSRAISDPVLRPKMRQYQSILTLTLRELERREQHRGNRPPESEAMRARRLRLDEDLSGYSSDHRGPVPLENWTTVENPLGPTPIDAADLRRRLENRKLGGDQWQYRPAIDHQPRPNSPQPSSSGIMSVCVRVNGDRNRDEPGPSGLQRVVTRRRTPSPSNMSTSSDDASTGSRRTRELSPHSFRSHNSARSRSSVSSYQSGRMERQTRPRHDIPLPPIRDRNPQELDQHNPDLIGMSEIYIRKPARGCPYCGEDHRMYRCPPFRALQLLEKWYHALNGGVCLNCLRQGHSSFRCLKEGACRRCGTRHNSLLCPRHPENR